MRRFSLALGILAAPAACAPSGVPPEIHGLDDEVVAVGEELVVVVSGADEDGDHLSYSFSSDVPDINTRARMTRLPRGAGEFRWTPLAEDVGEWFFDFHASDGTHTVTATIKVDVRSAVGANTAPRFVRPQGMGTTLNLEQKACVELNIEVEDSDSAEVEIAQERPEIVGAELLKIDDLKAVWTWCPSERQVDAEDRYTLKLSADDGEHPKTLHPYLVVLRRAQKPDCPGEPPAIAHAPGDEATLVGLTVPAEIRDDQGLKQEPLLYYATEEPSEPLDLGPDGPFTQHTMLLIDGDMEDGTWAADIPNPVANEPPGTSRDLWYVIVAQDDDDEGGNCDHLTQSQVYRMTVTNPGGSGGAGPCVSCTADVQCGGSQDLCVRVGTGSASFCLQECSGDGDCPSDYVCSDSPVESVDGEMARQCVPASSDCSDPAGAICEDDSFEDNDSQLDAFVNPLLETGTHQAVSCPESSGFGDDEDWYEILLDSEGTVDLQLSGGSESDLDLALYDSDGAELGASTSFSSNESLSVCLTAGYYTARVYAFGSEENGYTLSHQQTPGACEESCEPDENEEDDDAAGARSTEPFSEPHSSTTQSICAGDQDWYAVELFANEALLAELTFTHADGDLDLYVYDSDGTTNLTPCCSASGQSSSDDESLEYTAPADGTYYVVVDGYVGAENLYDISISAFTNL